MDKGHVVMNFDIGMVRSTQAICDSQKMHLNREILDLDEGKLVDLSAIYVHVASAREFVKNLDNHVVMPLETKGIWDTLDTRTNPYLHEKGKDVLINSLASDEVEDSAPETPESSGIASKEAHKERTDRGSTDSKSSDEEISLDLHDSNYVKVADRRIVDFNFVLEQLHKKFDNHGCAERSISSLKLEKYVDRGLRTLFYFRCQNCGYVNSIWTDRDDDSIMGVNQSAICGTITAGTGFSMLQEMLAAMAIPCMSHVTYRKYRDRLYPAFAAAVDEETKRAGAEERDRAITKGQFVTIDGCTYATIFVIADGCWAKRPYQGGKYDSLPGAATIIGAETGKALFVAVRNKYCSTCQGKAAKGRTPGACLLQKLGS